MKWASVSVCHSFCGLVRLQIGVLRLQRCAAQTAALQCLVTPGSQITCEGQSRGRGRREAEYLSSDPVAECWDREESWLAVTWGLTQSWEIRLADPFKEFHRSTAGTKMNGLNAFDLGPRQRKCFCAEKRASIFHLVCHCIIYIQFTINPRMECNVSNILRQKYFQYQITK